MAKRAFICAVIIILVGVSAFTQSANAEFKEGWSQKAIEESTSGCVTAMVLPQVEAYKQKTGYKGEGMPPEFEQFLPTLKKEIGVLCSCVTEKMANKWSFQEATQLNLNKDPQIQNFLATVIKSGECSLPFNIDASK